MLFGSLIGQATNADHACGAVPGPTNYEEVAGIAHPTRPGANAGFAQQRPSLNKG